MISHAYRFRSTNAVLDGFQELEKQEIYFSAPAELNDPMEGFKDLFWSGDEIVWRNLLKHYILCLLETATQSFVLGPDFDRNSIDGTIFQTPDVLPQAPIRAIFQKASETFLDEPAAKEFLSVLSTRAAPVRRDELTSYLRGLHPFALQAALNEFAHHGVLPTPSRMSAEGLESLRKSVTGMISGSAKLPTDGQSGPNPTEALFSANELMTKQMDLISDYNSETTSATKPLGFLFRYFPASYVRALDRLVHPDWYVACFSTNPINASMWGKYGDGHRGVCLKFKASPDSSGSPALELNQINGFSGDKTGGNFVRSFVRNAFHRVDYSQAYPAVDFFRSLGRVTIVNQNHFWYLGDKREFSSCRRAQADDEVAWRKNYWDTFLAGSLRKTGEWSYEQEYRLTLHSNLFDLRAPEMRKLRYKFEDLSGIVFGTRTTEDDKLRIMRIIEAKCRKEGRREFEFSEVQFSRETASFRLAQLGLLKFA